jgi:trafficking protein particle complex subunit 9
VKYPQQTSASASREPWSDVSDKLNQAMAIYFRAPSSLEAEPRYDLIAYLYTCAVLRQANLLYSIWSAKGWGPLAFTTMLQPGPAPYIPPTLSHGSKHSWLYLERLSSLSGVFRSSIASVLAQAHGPWLLHLGPIERIAALEVMAGMYSCLGFRRKETYILREVLGCIMDLLVCGREEDDYSRRSSVLSPSALGIQSLTLGNNQNDARGNVGVRQIESTEGNESILKLLKYICHVLGITLDAVRLIDVGKSGADQTATDPSSSQEGDDADIVQEPYGWPELQVGVVREAVAVAEALPGSYVHVSIMLSLNIRKHRLPRCRTIRFICVEDITPRLATW